MNRNLIAFGLTLISVGLLIPGLFYPILNISIGAEVPVIGKIVLFERTQNILETTQTLYDSSNEIPAILIILFSVVVPFVKAVIITLVLVWKDFKQRKWLYMFVHAIGKWSMADVFVVGVFIAYLSTQSNDSIVAELRPGFYYFTGYCLVSLSGIQFMKLANDKK